MATPEQKVSAAMQGFGELAADATVSALRTLAWIGLRAAESALAAGDYRAAQEAAYALLQTLEALEARG